MVKNLSAIRETWVRFLGWEDPLEKGMATHSNILAWKIPRTEEPGGLQSAHEVAKSWTRLSDSISPSFTFIILKSLIFTSPFDSQNNLGIHK